MLIEILLQILYFIAFLFISFIVFTIPGKYILKILRIHLRDFYERFSVSTVLGICVFTVVAYSLAFVDF
jgi:hypothetical protein